MAGKGFAEKHKDCRCLSQESAYIVWCILSNVTFVPTVHSLTQSNLDEGPAAYQSFRGLMRTSLMDAWHRVLEAVGEECGWGPPLRDLPENFVKETLPNVQHVVSRTWGIVKKRNLWRPLTQPQNKAVTVRHAC